MNEHARVSFRYNSLGLPVEERCDAHLIERGYDKHGLIVSLRSSLGAQLSYERNAYGELVCFRADEAETNARFTSEHQYDSLGFELERLLPGGVSQSFAYDNIGRLVDSKTRRSAEQRRSRHYRWGSADRLLSIEDDRYGLTQYSYSPSGELTMATYADGTKEYRLSDRVGNLYNDPDKKLRKYLEGGRIEKSGEWTFKYDKDGQLIEKFRGKAGFFSAKKDRWEYHWTQNGMLEGVRSPHRYGQWTRFTYDALGRRLTKLGDVTFHYLWNGNVPLHEWRTGERYEDGGLKSYSEDLKTWLFEEESFVPLALIQEGKTYSIVCDQLGTPTEAYDEEGKEVWYRRLDMNGKVLEETQPGLNPEGYVSISFLFQGQYYDHETGLAYNRFRYYDPELGRYISQDPIGLAGGIKLYGYVEDPLYAIDILGLSPGSRALDKALGGVKGDQKMAHHLIPEKTWDAHDDFFNRIGLSGQRDAASNGLLMSDSRKSAISHGNKLYHSSRHRVYTAMVNAKINKIRNRFNLGEITKDEAVRQVRSLQKSLRRKINKGTIKEKSTYGRLK